MEEISSRYINIKLEMETGRMVEIVDENGKKADPVSQAEIITIYESDIGFKHIGTILHTHSSPGCVTVKIAGKAFRLCDFS